MEKAYRKDLNGRRKYPSTRQPENGLSSISIGKLENGFIRKSKKILLGGGAIQIQIIAYIGIRLNQINWIPIYVTKNKKTPNKLFGVMIVRTIFN